MVISMKKTSISFGLVNIPVEINPIIKNNDIIALFLFECLQFFIVKTSCISLPCLIFKYFGSLITFFGV